jgi:hypothetical protein
MKKPLLLFALSAIPVLSWGQTQLSPQVFSSQGGDFSNAQFGVSYTIGEMSSVSTISNGNFTLTQGFHQPDKYQIALVESIDASWNAEVYPNPADEQLTLKLSSEKMLDLTLDLYDAEGRKVMASRKLNQVPGTQTYTVETSDLAAGAYLLRMTSADGKHQRSFRITKMNS